MLAAKATSASAANVFFFTSACAANGRIRALGLVAGGCFLGGTLASRQPLSASRYSADRAYWSKAAVALYAKTGYRALRSEADKKEMAVVAQREVDGRSS